jgi:hypothetical protein
METRQSYDHGLVMSAMADTYSASWNNFNLRYYSSYGVECPQRCGWVNATTSSFYGQIETAYYGYYSTLSSANDGVIAIRNNNVKIGSAANTKMVETMGVMMQGLTLMGIALNYDKGFIVDETTDLSDPLGLPLVSRAEMRDAAFAKLEDARTMAAGNSFVTPTEWTGKINGQTYTNTQLAQVIRTMQANLLANYPRSGAEVAAVNWGQVATLASQGIQGFTFQFFIDLDFDFFDGIKRWGNSAYTVRVDTRLAALIPGSNQANPWPAGGSPQPNSPDKRVGDGSWGPADNITGTNSVKATANAGTDFAWHGLVIFPSARGSFHQGNLAHMRYSCNAYEGEGLPDEDGSCQAPTLTQGMNDLLWAEALIRSGGSKAQAALLINRTRVGRGNLAARTGAEANSVLLDDVKYESLIENLGLGPDVFYTMRRYDALWAQTPRQYPIPAKELQLLSLELYSFGGANNPDMAPGAVPMYNGKPVKSVRDIWAEKSAAERAATRSLRKF